MDQEVADPAIDLSHGETGQFVQTYPLQIAGLYRLRLAACQCAMIGVQGDAEMGLGVIEFSYIVDNLDLGQQFFVDLTF